MGTHESGQMAGREAHDAGTRRTLLRRRARREQRSPRGKAQVMAHHCSKALSCGGAPRQPQAEGTDVVGAAFGVGLVIHGEDLESKSLTKRKAEGVIGTQADLLQQYGTHAEKRVTRTMPKWWADTRLRGSTSEPGRLALTTRTRDRAWFSIGLPH